MLVSCGFDNAPKFIIIFEEPLNMITTHVIYFEFLLVLDTIFKILVTFSHPCFRRSGLGNFLSKIGQLDRIFLLQHWRGRQALEHLLDVVPNFSKFFLYGFRQVFNLGTTLAQPACLISDPKDGCQYRQADNNNDNTPRHFIDPFGHRSFPLWLRLAPLQHPRLSFRFQWASPNTSSNSLHSPGLIPLVSRVTASPASRRFNASTPFALRFVPPIR